MDLLYATLQTLQACASDRIIDLDTCQHIAELREDRQFRLGYLSSDSTKLAQDDV
jgi:hypothetical protein